MARTGCERREPQETRPLGSFSVGVSLHKERRETGSGPGIVYERKPARLVFRAAKKYPELTGIFAGGFVDELRIAAMKPDVTELAVDPEDMARVGSKAPGGMYCAVSGHEGKRGNPAGGEHTPPASPT
jgi:hypothetical protein